MLVIATYRDEIDAERAELIERLARSAQRTKIELSGFDDHEVRRAACARRAPPETMHTLVELTVALHDVTGGNPALPAGAPPRARRASRKGRERGRALRDDRRDRAGRRPRARRSPARAPDRARAPRHLRGGDRRARAHRRHAGRDLRARRMTSRSRRWRRGWRRACSSRTTTRSTGTCSRTRWFAMRSTPRIPTGSAPTAAPADRRGHGTAGRRSGRRRIDVAERRHRASLRRSCAARACSTRPPRTPSARPTMPPSGSRSAKRLVGTNTPSELHSRRTPDESEIGPACSSRSGERGRTTSRSSAARDALLAAAASARRCRRRGAARRRGAGSRRAVGRRLGSPTRRAQPARRSAAAASIPPIANASCGCSPGSRPTSTTPTTTVRAGSSPKRSKSHGKSTIRRRWQPRCSRYTSGIRIVPRRARARLELARQAYELASIEPADEWPPAADTPLARRRPTSRTGRSRSSRRSLDCLRAVGAHSWAARVTSTRRWRCARRRRPCTATSRPESSCTAAPRCAATSSSRLSDGAYFLQRFVVRYQQGRLSEEDRQSATGRRDAVGLPGGRARSPRPRTRRPGKPTARSPITRRILGPDGSGLPRDAFWLGGTALFAGVAAAAGDLDLIVLLYGMLEGCADHVVVFGAGGAVLGSGHHWLGVLAAACGHTDVALEHLAEATAIAKELGRSLLDRAEQHRSAPRRSTREGRAGDVARAQNVSSRSDRDRRAAGLRTRARPGRRVATEGQPRVRATPAFLSTTAGTPASRQAP